MTDGDTLRKNGLQWPPHKLQILTWILFPLVLAHFYGFLRPLIWFTDSLGIALIVLFTVSSVAAVIFGYLTCLIDPSDDSIIHGQVPGIDKTQTVYCYLCESNVDKSSKHCRYCQKCVTRFDHHCKWLNTCVGSKNYFYFLGAVFSIGTLTSISLALSIAYLVEIFAFESRVVIRLEGSDAHPTLDSVGVKVISVISVALLLPLVGLVYQLMGFHCMLLLSNITTYEFIVQEQKRQRERIQLESAPRAKSAQSPAQRPIPVPLKPSENSSLNHESGINKGSAERVDAEFALESRDT
jgi:palmitoyltransferase